MKRLLTWAGYFIIISAAVFCTMGALISAFSFSVDIRTLSVVWLATAFALSTSATLWRGKGILVLAFPAMAAIIWKLTDIIEGAKWAAFFITNEYSKWLLVSVLFPGAEASAYELTLFFAAAGTVLAFLLSVAVFLRSSASLTISFTAPPVSLTLILIEHHSDFYFLLGLIAVYLTLIISSALHPDDVVKSGRAIIFALFITAMIMGVAYLAAPPDSQRRGELAILVDSRVRNISERAGVTISNSGIGWPETFTGAWRFNTNNVAVADAGRRIITDRNLLEINSSQAGTFYLRGYSMQLFDGREWSNNPDISVYHEEEISMMIPVTIAEIYGQHHPDDLPATVSMVVTMTGDSSNIIYQPYYTYDAYPFDGFYFLDFYHLGNSIFDMAFALPPDTIYVPEELNMLITRIYTQVNNSTAEGLRDLAAQNGISANADRAIIANQVAEYISSAARYTLSPHIIPKDEDFALYFLESSREGYCIHFATAATLMLRSLDVPARFTSGFTVTIPEGRVGQDIVITDRQAHAWVEVYYNDVGWVHLEVTSASPVSGVPERLPHSIPAVSSAPEPSDQPESSPESTSPPTPRYGADTGSQEQPSFESSDRNVWIIILCIAVCALSLFLCRIIVRKLRKRGFAQADTNAAVIYAWHYISRLTRRKKPPEEINELAFKARFSQHRISEDERNLVINYAAKLTEETISSKGLLERFWLKYVCGL